MNCTREFYNDRTNLDRAPILTPFDDATHNIHTKLPVKTAIIRALAIGALTTLAALLSYKLGATFLAWPVLLAGTAYAVYVLFLNFKKDPMIEAFYKIVGGAEKFEKLPYVNLSSNWGNKGEIMRIWHDVLHHDISRSSMSDGRKIVIIKGCQGNPNDVEKWDQRVVKLGDHYKKSIDIMIERASYEDVKHIQAIPRYQSQFLEQSAKRSMFGPIFDWAVREIAPTFRGKNSNLFGIQLYCFSDDKCSYECRVTSYLHKELAKGLYAHVKRNREIEIFD